MTNGLNKLAEGIGKAVEVVPEVYDDLLKPAAQESGKALALIPKAVNAALSPCRKWMAQQEYNVAEVEKLLSQKLEHVGEDMITTPEAYVAVPAIQAISYSMGSPELRNLYANLLSKSMYEVTKNFVHPSFVESIKQMSPLDARLFHQLSTTEFNGVVDLVSGEKFDNEFKMYLTFEILETNILGYDLASHNLQSASLEMLRKLGFIEISTESNTDEYTYQRILLSSEYKKLLELHSTRKNLYEKRKVFKITNLGKMFVDICINDIH